jgi:hypothetical protein
MGDWWGEAPESGTRLDSEVDAFCSTHAGSMRCRAAGLSRGRAWNGGASGNRLGTFCDLIPRHNVDASKRWYIIGPFGRVRGQDIGNKRWPRHR